MPDPNPASTSEEQTQASSSWRELPRVLLSVLVVVAYLALLAAWVSRVLGGSFWGDRLDMATVVFLSLVAACVVLPFRPSLRGAWKRCLLGVGGMLAGGVLAFPAAMLLNRLFGVTVIAHMFVIGHLVITLPLGPPFGGAVALAIARFRWRREKDAAEARISAQPWLRHRLIDLGLVLLLAAGFCAAFHVMTGRAKAWNSTVARFHHAIRRGDMNAVRGMLRSSPSLATARKRDTGKTSLEAASRYGRNDIACLLVQHGAEHNVWTATQLGLKGDVVRFMGQDPELLRECAPGGTLLHYAARSNQPEIVQFLIEHGANVDAMADDLNRTGTPLHAAAWGNSAEAAEILIAGGADVNASAAEDEETPLHIAARAGSTEVARLLLANGAEVDAMSIRGKTPLRKAVVCGSVGVLEALLERGAHVDRADLDFATRYPIKNREKTVPLLKGKLSEQGVRAAEETER